MVFATCTWAARPGLVCVLHRRQESRWHKDAVFNLLGLVPGTQPGRHCVGSPPPEEFHAELEHLLLGRATPGPGMSSSKTRAMKWCLEEALLESQREALSQASSITLCRDERAQRLLVRYSCCSKNLEMDRGMLGLAKDFGTGAEQTTEATGAIIRRFCTVKHGCPTNDAQPCLDEGLLAHIKSKIEVLVVDAAADELLSGDIGRGRRSAATEMTEANLTPNVLRVARDLAHASRRHNSLV